MPTDDALPSVTSPLFIAELAGAMLIICNPGAGRAARYSSGRARNFSRQDAQQK